MVDLQYHFEFVAVFGAAPAFKKILNAANSPEQSKGLGGNIGCKDKHSTWY